MHPTCTVPVTSGCICALLYRSCKNPPTPIPLEWLQANSWRNRAIAQACAFSSEEKFHQLRSAERLTVHDAD